MPDTPSDSLGRLLDGLLDTRLAAWPQEATRLRLDTGPRAALRRRLDASSAADIATYLRHLREAAASLRAIDPAGLDAIERIDRDAVLFHAEAALDVAAALPHGLPTEAQPYVVTQLHGAYYAVPDFLCTQHPVESPDDADAFVDRLAAFATALDDETARADAAAADGVLPPAFVLDTTLANLDALLPASGLEATLVDSLAGRARARGLAGDWETPVRELLARQVRPALERQRQSLARHRERARADAGLWTLPGGEAGYARAIVSQTTCRMGAAEIHETGLAQVVELTARLDDTLRAQGFGDGTVAQRLAALAVDERFVYPNDAQGKARLLDDLRALVADVQRRLPQWFGTLPRAALEVRAVPAAIESGAPRGYYSSGSADGREPGAFYVNLRDTRDWKRWYAPSFACHEGVPGHHLQIALALETPGMSMMRRVLWFAAHGEGWALYAEQLADEMGLYEHDPMGRVGYLQSMLFRAARLVVDTGLHALRWPRERAIAYLVETVGETVNRSTAEVDRYCVMPAQALSYKVGHLRWQRLRDACRARDGAAFDLRRFHDRALALGGMPLELLDAAV